MNKKMYIDMDGVLADFDGQPNALERFSKEKGFFQTLKPLPFLKILNEMLEQNNNNIYILSASPNKVANKDKYLWIIKHCPLMKLSNVIFINTSYGQKKSDYCQKGDILIDDYSNNLLDWESKGGKGIKMLNPNSKRLKWKGKCYKYNLEQQH